MIILHARLIQAGLFSGGIGGDVLSPRAGALLCKHRKNEKKHGLQGVHISSTPPLDLPLSL